MNNLLTIGEVAELFEIATSQIRFYERKGLIEPTMIGENGYRYYDFKVIDRLSVIILLRDLEVPIAGIKEAIKKDRKDFQVLIQDSRNKVEKEIKRLKTLLERVDYMSDEIEKFEDDKLEVTYFKDREVFVFSSADVFNMSERESYDYLKENNLSYVNINHDLYYVRVSAHTHLYCMHDKQGFIPPGDQPKHILQAGEYLEWCTNLEDMSKIDEVLKVFDDRATSLNYQLAGERIIVNELSSILYATTGIPIKIQGRIQD